IDDDHLRAGGPRLADLWPVVEIGDDRIATPDDDEAAPFEVVRQHAEGSAVDRGHPGAPGAAADRAHQPRSAEAGEESAVETGALDQPDRAKVAEGEDRLRAVALDRLAQTGGDLRQRLVPRNALEAPFPLLSDPAQRMEHPLRAVDPLQV